MKKFLHYSILSLTLIVFLISTSGISIIEHYCSHAHERYVFIFHSHPSCNDLASAEDHSCCDQHLHTATCSCPQTASDDEDCCTNTEKFYKLLSEFIGQFPTNDYHTPIFVASTSFFIPIQGTGESTADLYQTVPPARERSNIDLYLDHAQFRL